MRGPAVGTGKGVAGRVVRRRILVFDGVGLQNMRCLEIFVPLPSKTKEVEFPDQTHRFGNVFYLVLLKLCGVSAQAKKRRNAGRITLSSQPK